MAGKSIRSKLIRLILTISNLSLLVAFAVLYTYEIVSYRQMVAGQLQVQANMLAQNSTAALAFSDTLAATDLLFSLKTEPKILAAALYTHDSSLFVQVNFSESESMPVKLGINENAHGDFEILVPVVQGNRVLGTLYIRRGSNDVKEKIFVYSLIVLSVLLFCFGLTYLLSTRFEKSISAPIIELANASELIAKKHDYSVRAETNGEGELRTLTDAFNLMLSKIENQNHEIQCHAQELEMKVKDRTIEINRQKDFAETIINSSLVLIAVFDAETRFIGFNKRCEIEFGMRREDVLGKRFAEVMPNVVGSPAYKSVLRALDGQTSHYEQYRSTVSGHYYENFGIPLRDENNEVYAALLTAHNITAAVIANEKLIQSNDELKKKNADLEQFAYVASHDLQEPLRKIQFFADVAIKTVTIDFGSTNYLKKIQTSANRMSRLIKDVLEYSRLSRIEESFVDVDLNIILEYIKSDFELVVAEKDAVIENDYLPVIKGNKLQLHQLFANLINNALKFNERTPFIKITVESLTAKELEEMILDKSKYYCKLSFTDNGIGFDTFFKGKLFTIFQRLHSRDKYEGTGIGLALCKKIVDNHKGHISVSSMLGEGSTFTVVLPYT